MKQKFIGRVGLAVILVAFFGPSGLTAQVVKTPAEECGYSSYSQHAEIAVFLSRVDHLAAEVAVKVIGQTLPVREFGARDLYLVIINQEGVDVPEGLNRSRPTVFLIASQHGNEQSAKEAALRLIRDFGLGELKPLLQKVNVLILPQANPFGNRFDRRQNEQDLDLNRDHVKLESPETRAIHRVFRQWMPEVTIDVHEKGDDYYRVSIGCVSNVNISPALQEFSRRRVLDVVEKKLAKQRISFFEYLVSQEMGLDSSAGVRYRPEELAGREEMLRYSTTDLNDGRNSLGIYETLSFIQEGASRHDLATLEERTRWQYEGLRAFIEAVADSGEEALRLVRASRAKLLERASLTGDTDPVHLRMEYVRDEKQPSLTIKRFERTESPIRGILKADKKAGDLLTAADIAPYPYPPATKVVTEVVKNWFPGVAPTLSVERPLGYIIPAQFEETIENLLDHGIAVDMILRDATLDVEAGLIEELVPAKYDYLPPEKIGVSKKEMSVLAKKGDFYVSCAQPAANLIPCLLEPQSQYGLVRYRAFRLIPEAGNFYPILRVVKPVKLSLVPYRNW